MVKRKDGEKSKDDIVELLLDGLSSLKFSLCSKIIATAMMGIAQRIKEVLVVFEKRIKDVNDVMRLCAAPVVRVINCIVFLCLVHIIRMCAIQCQMWRSETSRASGAAYVSTQHMMGYQAQHLSTHSFDLLLQ